MAELNFNDFDFVLNRLIIPIVFAIIPLCINYYRKDIEKYLKKGKKRPLLFFLDGFRIELGNWRYTILAPLFIALLFVIITDLYFSWLRQPFVSYGEPFWFSSLTSGILAPIAEEFIFRGFFISFAIFLGLYLIKPHTKNTEFIVNNVALFVITFFFALGHPNRTVFDFMARFLLGLLAGLLYVLSERNLLPPMIAHAVFNWYVILK